MFNGLTEIHRSCDYLHKFVCDIFDLYYLLMAFILIHSKKTNPHLIIANINSIV